MGTIDSNSISLTNQQMLSQVSYGLTTFIGLNVKTEEGDMVSISFDNELNYSELSDFTSFSTEEHLADFSVKALAVAQYSIVVKGELNKEESSAIEKLVKDFKHIAESLSDSDFHPERIHAKLEGFLGTLTDIKLSLKKSETTTYISENFGGDNFRERGNIPGNLVEEFPVEQIPKIRDLAGLVQSVIDAVFKNYKKEFPEDSFLKNLEDLKKLLVTQLSQGIARKTEVSKTERMPKLKPDPSRVFEHVLV